MADESGDWNPQTHVWDATVTNESNGRTMALFRCTQMVLAPR